MTCTCPLCGNTHAARTRAPIEQSVDELRAWCQENGHLVLRGDRVREATAAALVERSLSSLQRWAHSDQRLPFAKVSAGRVYELRAIAEFLGGGA